MRRLLGALAGALIVSGALEGAEPQENARPYLAPWIVLPDSGAAFSAWGTLAAMPPGKMTPNSEGVLFDVPAGSGKPILEAFDPEAPRWVAPLVSSAHAAGLRAGIAVSLPDVPVPADPRAAEAATAGTLFPGGLGTALFAARGADLFELHFPDLANLQARSFVLKKLAAELRAQNPAATIAVTFTAIGDALFPPDAEKLLANGNAAYVDMVGLRMPPLARAPDPAALRAASDALALGRPLLVRTAGVQGVDALLAIAGREAPAGAPFVAASLATAPTAEDFAVLARLGALLSGDFGDDTRPARARTTAKTELPVTRVVSGTDLGGVVLVHAVAPDDTAARGPATLDLDSSDYASAEILELHSGRSKRFDVPRSSAPTRLTLSTATGTVAVVLTAREKAPSEATKARVGVTAVRGITAEEILARHQVWRARRDARWHRFVATNRTSIRFRFADLNNTLDLTLGGPFFYEQGKGYDWVWSDAWFNGVKWKGKKIPELPLLQPEKVSELPLTLTFNDAYTYVLVGEETVNGVKCWALDFTPKEKFSDKPIYAGRVFISEADFGLARTNARQLNLSGEVQSVDERADFGDVPAPDGGQPLRFPTRTVDQWVLRTFSRTTVLERETTLSDVRIDPPGYEEERRAAYASKDVMVRDTDKGVRYLEKTKEGERVVVEDEKSARLFGLGGVFYDSSLDYPLPLLGVYWLDLNFRRRHQQAQVFFGGVLLAASFSEPRLAGTKADLGADVFGVAVQGTDRVYVNGTEDKAQGVKQRSFAANLNFGYPVARHVKVTGQLGLTHRDFGRVTDETDPAFAIPSDHFVLRAQAQAIWDFAGYALSARFGWNKRTTWNAWGLPGNPEYDPGKDMYRTFGAQLSKDFHFANFRRIRASIGYFGSRNTDRFSKYGFGGFDPTTLKGFSSGRLRGEQAAIARAAYGIVIGEAFRLEVVYDHALVKDTLLGYDWASFGGAGVSGEFPGPWSTLVRLDAGAPVVGRNRGQRGFSLNLVFLKIF
jgi:hypothetical protein